MLTTFLLPRSTLWSWLEIDETSRRLNPDGKNFLVQCKDEIVAFAIHLTMDIASFATSLWREDLSDEGPSRFLCVDRLGIAIYS